MSLETSVAALTAAIENLTKVLSHGKCVEETRIVGATREQVMEKVAPTVAEPAPAPAPTPKKAKKEAAPPAPKVEEPVNLGQAKDLPPQEEPAPAPAPAGKLTLQDLRAVAQKALDNGKLAEVVKLNKEFGLKRISEAPEDKYEEIIARLTEIANG